MEIPDFIPKEIFNDFLAMRIEEKVVKSNSDRSVKIMVNKLRHWYEMGYDLKHIILECTEKQYRGLFLPVGIQPKKRPPLKAASNVAEKVSGLVKKVKLPPPPTEEEMRISANKALEKLRLILD